MGGQLVYTPDGDVLDKHLYVLRRAPGGFDWEPEADEARIDQLAIALLADSVTKNIALDHYKEFAQYLREELEGEEWRLPTSDISSDTWSRAIDVADETPSPEDVDITAVDFDEMTFAVERALCEQHDISIHQSVDDRREELEEGRQAVQSETTDSEELRSDTGGFEFPAASQ
ncbi:DUF6166 domain-containing protein [Salarchaeum sp. JOR-1]|uniref:DUF6166 domain-containing protein n=1 Tax=Salarchaeum sp. JOR-1 TaxID=2599399 RepID=UPI001F0EF95A|nr:DUF6166 domain-containing protein [Salarchaeum sp. JOR-1]